MNARHARAPIVVGLDEEPRTLIALRWAAREAAAMGLPLRLVHAVDRKAELSIAEELCLHNPVGEVDRAIAARGRDLAAVAEAMVYEVAPGAEVDLTLEDGAPVDVLTHAGAGAALLVLGGHGRGLLGRVLLGSVGAAIGAAPPCPLAVIRAPGPADGDTLTPVIVGVDGTASSLAALDFAAGHATRHGCPLLVVTARGDGIGDTHPADLGIGWLRERTGPVEKRYPDLHVVHEMAPGSPRRALVERSTRARLMVVGATGDPARPGSVGQALLHHSWAPVAIVPRRH